MRMKVVPAILSRPMRRLHLHLRQPRPAVHHKIIPIAVTLEVVMDGRKLTARPTVDIARRGISS